MKVELVYEKSCPNVDAAREQLRKAFDKLDKVPVWQEWEVSNPRAPEYVRNYGSPTILVNEQDVSGQAACNSGNNCRVYDGDSGNLSVVPSLAKIVTALAEQVYSR